MTEHYSKMEVEQFDNGITIIYNTGENRQALVCLEGQKKSLIGEILLEDIENIMNSDSVNKVTLNIKTTTDEQEGNEDCSD